MVCNEGEMEGEKNDLIPIWGHNKWQMGIGKQMLSAICFGFFAPRASDAPFKNEQVGPADPLRTLPALKCNDSPGADETVDMVFKDLLYLLLSSAGQPAEYDQKIHGPDLTTAASLPWPRAAMAASVVMSFMHG